MQEITKDDLRAVLEKLTPKQREIFIQIGLNILHLQDAAKEHAAPLLTIEEPQKPVPSLLP